jgi:hypothetical protein
VRACLRGQGGRQHAHVVVLSSGVAQQRFWARRSILDPTTTRFVVRACGIRKKKEVSISSRIISEKSQRVQSGYLVHHPGGRRASAPGSCDVSVISSGNPGSNGDHMRHVLPYPHSRYPSQGSYFLGKQRSWVGNCSFPSRILRKTIHLNFAKYPTRPAPSYQTHSY